jgi:hypothetical protein
LFWSIRERPNAIAHLRHVLVTRPPSARDARERDPVPSGAAAC